MSKRDELEETESIGSDKEQIIAMLEKAEIDYDITNEDEDDEDEDAPQHVEISGEVRFSFDGEGNLSNIEVIQ